jgi:hypothetical protein
MEQRARRLDASWTRKIGWEYDPDIEAELVRVVKEEMAKELKRAANKAPTVSDKIPRLPNK